MKIKSSNRPKPQRKVYYVCNRKRCERCFDECHHTTQIEYALYETHDVFEPGVDGSIWEAIHGKA